MNRIPIGLLTLILVLAAGAASARCTRDQARRAVEHMAGLLTREGPAALRIVRAFRFCRNNYVWVFTPQAVLLVNPTLPQLEGRDVLDLKDDQGKQFYVYFLKAGKSARKTVGDKVYYVGSGWVGYRWRRIGGRAFLPKCGYIKGVIMGGRNVFLGAGVYARCPRGAL
jgi:signal transduction histidine kinase